MGREDSLITLEVPGVVVVTMDFDDRGKWPGMKVQSWDKRGRGWSCRTEGPRMVWGAALFDIEGRIDQKQDTSAARTALRKFALTLRQKLKETKPA